MDEALEDKYDVGKAYIFLGFIPENAGLYKDLQNAGYVVVFKPTIFNVDGEVKGNCDAELVLQAVVDMYEMLYNKAVIVSGDGDFACLVNFLKEKDRLGIVLAPNAHRASVLLKRAVHQQLVFLDRHEHKLAYHKKKNVDHT